MNSKNLPNFVTAGSPMGLRQKMFAINARSGSFHKFFDISQYKEKSGKSKWIAWYYVSIKDEEIMEDAE